MADAAVSTIVTDPNAGETAAAAVKVDPAAGGGDAAAAAKSPDLGADGKPKVEAAASSAAATDWRKEFSGDNADDLKALERFTSKADFLKSWKEQRAAISAGKHKEPLAANATEEQKAEYRKANGIPEKAEDYFNALPQGLVFGEDDKPAVTKFLNDMHGLNAPPTMVSKALETFVAAQTEAALHRSELDVKVRDESAEALRAEWGADYKANVNSMSAFVKSNIPEDAQANFLNARMGDGTPIFSHPAMVKAFAQLGRTLNPTGAVTPGGGIDKLDAIQDAIGGYEKRMANDRAAWFKDTKSQEHYRQLVDARDNMTKKK